MRIRNKQMFLWTLRGKPYFILSLSAITLLILVYLVL